MRTGGCRGCDNCDSVYVGDEGDERKQRTDRKRSNTSCGHADIISMTECGAEFGVVKQNSNLDHRVGAQLQCTTTPISFLLSSSA